MSTTTLSLFLRHMALSEQVSRLGTASDQDLLIAHESGRREAAFAELMRRYGPMVLRTCRRVLGRGPDAEDAFQATFIFLARQGAHLRKGTAGRLSLGGWLHRVAYRTALNVLTGNTRRRAHERQASAMTHADLDPFAETSWNEILPILDAELNALPEQARQLLIACYLQGKTHAEAAAELGLPPGSMSWRLEQARTLLATRLVRRGVTVSIGLLTVLLGGLASEATVPAVLLVHTLEAVRTFNEQAGGVVSGHVAHLVKRALVNMTPSWTKLGVVLACCLGLAGTALVTCQALSARPGEPGEAGPAATQAPRQPGLRRHAAGRVDRQGDPLPEGVLARLGTTRLRHAGGVLSVALASDGKTVLTGGEDGTVRLWEAATGKEIRTLTGRLAKGVYVVTFSLDGKTVAAWGCDGTMHLWEAASGKPMRTLQGLNGTGGNMWAVALASDGKTVATGDWLNVGVNAEGVAVVHLWEVATGKEIRTLKWKEGEGIIQSVAFSPDGKTVAAGKRHNGDVRLWDVATGKEIHTLQGHNEGAIIDNSGRVAFSPDGKILAVGEKDGKVYLWEAATGKKIRTFQAHKRQVWLIVFSPDGKTVATAQWENGDDTVRLWEAATGKLIQTLQGHKGKVCSMAFASDGKTVVTGGADGTVRLWDAATGKPTCMQRGHAGPAFKVAFASDGKTVVTGGCDETVRLWDAATGEEIRTLKGWTEEGEEWIMSVAFASDGKTVTARAWPGWVRLWEAATGKEIRTLKPAVKQRIMSEAFSPDSKTLATGETDGIIRLWTTTTGKEIRTLQMDKNKEAVLSVAFAPDGKTLAMGGGNGTVRLLEVAISGEEIRILQPKVQEVCLVTSVAFSPDGRIVATGGNVAPGRDGLVRLWEAATGKEIRNLQGKGQIVALTFSPDGKTMATSSGDRVQLWDLPSGDAFPSLAGHRGNVLGVAFSPDGKALASVSADTTGLVWDLTSRTARPATKPDPKALEALWADLASQDALRAWQAVWVLETMRVQAVPLLRDRLRPVPADAGKRLPLLVADLDADDFKVRQKAYQELEKLGPDAELALRKGLEGRPTVELRKRLKQLLEMVKEQKKKGFSEAVLGGLRAMAVLERIGTPPAREVLKTLATGGTGFRLTEEARTALRRLEGAKQP